MNDNDFCPYAYSPEGERYYESAPGHRQKRLSMIGCLSCKRLSAPCVFEGHCNTKIIETYIEKILVPTLKPGMTVILDNASFHKSDKIRKLIESASCHVKYLPPYSPDLNPIENWWHKIKTAIRKLKRDGEKNLENAMKIVLKEMSAA
jgi:transposase